MSKKINMVEVIALHDLSYTDHEGHPQYRRQGSKPFELDEDNAKQFEALSAVERVTPIVEADEFEDEFANKNEANVNKTESGVEAKANKNTLLLGHKGFKK